MFGVNMQPYRLVSLIRKLIKMIFSVGPPVHSLASHTLRKERKGLVTVQLLSCRQGTQLSTSAVR